MFWGETKRHARLMNQTNRKGKVDLKYGNEIYVVSR